VLLGGEVGGGEEALLGGEVEGGVEDQGISRLLEKGAQT